MDYIEAFKNLKTNNKYSRKSPHKAILLLSIIEMYETNVLSNNMILYDDNLKQTFFKVWERTLKDEPLFHPEVYFPFWYMQSEEFWHIIPNRGCEDVLALMRDNNVKPSESKLIECVKYAELDDDLFFLMSLPSGRSSLKRVLLETYFDLSEKLIEKLAESPDNAIDYSASALSEYAKILSHENNPKTTICSDANSEIVKQFQKLDEDLQIVINIQYYSFLKSHRGERKLFKDVCPTVYDLIDIILNHPVKQVDLSPSFAFVYDNFLSDLKISLMSENNSMELVEKIEDALNLLRGNNQNVDDVTMVEESVKCPPDTTATVIKKVDDNVYIPDNISEQIISMGNRRGKPWTNEEEELITVLFKQGKDPIIIAELLKRSVISINMRLAKLGLIEYTYGQDADSYINTQTDTQRQLTSADFTIDNSRFRCSILNKYNERVFVSDGKLKYLNGNIYRLNLKDVCFTVKIMKFNGEVWMRGGKRIVAYPQSELYNVLDNAIDYAESVEDIKDAPSYKDCKLKVNGVWYNYNGDRC